MSKYCIKDFKATPLCFDILRDVEYMSTKSCSRLFPKSTVLLDTLV